AARQDIYGAPVAMPFRSQPAPPPVTDEPVTRSDSPHSRALPQNDPAARNDVGAAPSSLPPRGRPAAADYSGRGRSAEEPTGYGPPNPQDQYRSETLDPHRGSSPAQPGPFRRPTGAPSDGPAALNGPAPPPGPGGSNGRV